MDSQTTTIVTIIIPLFISILLFGLGLGLTPADFTRLLKAPKVNLVGLGIKLLSMPLIGFGLAIVFKLDTDFAVGMVMLAAGPCSVLANIFTKMGDGDVALALTLTAVDNFITAFTFPIYTALAISYFSNGHESMGTQLGESVKIFLMILVPVSIGMFLRYKWPVRAPRIERGMKVPTIVLLLIIVAGVLIKEREKIINNFGQLGGAILILGVVGMALGYGFSRLMKISGREAIAISMVTGIQGTAFVAGVGISVFHNINYAIPAAVYTLFCYAGGFGGAQIASRYKLAGRH